MIIKPVIFDNILFGDLAPWCADNSNESRFRDILNNQVRINKDNPQAFFSSLISSLKDYSIQLTFDQLPTHQRLADLAKFADLQSLYDRLELQPHFNKASEFYRYLIINETTRILSAIANNVKSSKTSIDATYQVTSLLSNLEYTIEQVSQKSCTDRFCCYVIDSVKIALFRIYEEIKTMFPSYTGIEALSEGELLHQLAPGFELETHTPATFSFTIRNFLDAKNAPPLSEVISTLEIPAPKKTVFCSFTYIHLSTQPQYINDLFDSLKSHNFIPKNAPLTDFKKIFSGEPIIKPVIWTGNISELNYFIKLIHHTNKSVVNLKQRQWEVACKCFIKPDGSFFDRARLKDQKRPKSTAAILEKAAKHLG